MEANRILLQKKYTRIIMLLAEKKGISVEEALKIFYESDVYKMMSTGEAELHCRSDYYILDEILIEIEYSKLIKNGFADRMRAYEKAFSIIIAQYNQKED